MKLDDLPGASDVMKGLSDVRSGQRSIEALLVGIAEPRFRALGLWEPAWPSLGSGLEIELYRALGNSAEPDPYSAYNARLRELSSFIRALEGRVGRELRSAAGP